MFVALGIQNAMRMRHIVICELPDSKYFSISHKRHFIEKKKVTEHKTCGFAFYTTFVWRISRYKKIWGT